MMVSESVRAEIKRRVADVAYAAAILAMAEMAEWRQRAGDVLGALDAARMVHHAVSAAEETEGSKP